MSKAEPAHNGGQDVSHGVSKKAANNRADEVIDADEAFVSDARAVGARLETLGQEVETLTDSLNNTAQDVGLLLRRQLQARPYRTLGIAAGAGFILGGGLSLRMTSTLLGLGGRVLANRILQEVLKESQV